MRTTLAIACLAGVALANKSKNYRPKHTAERPSGECLTEEAWLYSDDDCGAIWMAWDDQCWENHTDECDEAFIDVFGVPEYAPAPADSCDDAYYWSSDNQACNEAWYAFDQWCHYSGEENKECRDGYAAWEARTDALVVMRKTQMQKKHSLQERKRAAGKRHQEADAEGTGDELSDCDEVDADATTDAGDAVRPTGDCLDWDAYVYSSGTDCDQVWRDWDEACSDNWTDECLGAETDMVTLVVEQAPLPACSFMDDDQECSDAWSAYLNWCWLGAETDTDVADCDAGQATMWDDLDGLFDGLFDDLENTDAVMRKTTMQRKHANKLSAAGKRALKKTAAKKRSGKKAPVNLAASSSAANDSQYTSGVAIGASVGVVAALGALYAISKCNKGSVDDFQRV